MANLEFCPFDNYNCLCQFCEDKCNNGLNCSDCNYKGKAVHEIHLCTGFKGDFEAYLNHWEEKVKEKWRNHND